MTKHEQDLLFQTLQLLRKETAKYTTCDWKDIDDHLFSILDFTDEELTNLYAGRDALIYTGSAIPGFSPAALTYDELLPYVAVVCECKERKTTFGIPVVVEAQIPGKPILLTSGDCPELRDHIGKSIQIVWTSGEIPEIAFWTLDKNGSRETCLFSITAAQ